MSASKQNQFRQEEEDIARGARAMNDSQRCSICLEPNPSNSPSNKCIECLEKMEKVPTGFNFNVLNGQENKDFECPICLSIIKGATELPCEHLMCAECLLHYEKEQRRKAKRDGSAKDAEFLCSVCMTPYKVQDKKSVKSTDRFIQNSIKVHCLQNECQWVGSIKDYEVHVKKCDYVVKLKCPYYELGCLTKFDGEQLAKHNAANKQIHESLLLNVVNVLAKERIENRQTFENQNKKIESLEERLGKVEGDNKQIRKESEVQKNLLKENAKNIESLKKENADLNKMLQTQNDNVFNVHEKLQTFENQNVELGNLKTFATTVGKLHETLSDLKVREKNYTSSYLYNKDYSQNKAVKQWNDFVQQININENFNKDCDYLNQMKNVLNRYQETVYTESWGRKLLQFANAIDPGLIINSHIKLSKSHVISLILIKTYSNQREFDTATQDMKWTKHSHCVASYLSKHQGLGCLNVAIWLPSLYKRIINILHWEEEDKKIRIAGNGAIITLDGTSHGSPFVMLQLEKWK